MLVVSSLVIALIMISTTAYVYELAGDSEVGAVHALSGHVQSIRIGTKNIVIGALANVTNTGQNRTLVTLLDRWKTAVAEHYAVGKTTLYYFLRETAPFSSGLYVAWSNEGTGVSEAFVNYAIVIKGNRVNMESTGYVNASSYLQVDGLVEQISQNSSQVTLTWNLFNEGHPALQENATLHHRGLTQWMSVDYDNDYVVTDYGNGTYRATFVLATLDSVDVSVRVLDKRGILVQANVTCFQP